MQSDYPALKPVLMAPDTRPERDANALHCKLHAAFTTNPLPS
jgi:hypothetical protein